MARRQRLARRDRYGRQLNRAHSPLLAYVTPWLSVMIASWLPSLPVTSALPLVPPLGLITLLAWRFVRPGLLPVWAGIPLGLVDDLFSGQPLGSAILLWSLALIAIEIVQARFPWRGFLQDWAYASLFVAIILFAGVFLSGARVTGPMLGGIVPQLLLSILLFPMIARMVAFLDRIRLMRLRTVS